MKDKEIKCPICGERDYVRYVFVDQYEGATGETTLENPTDTHFIYMCSSVHLYDERCEEIRRK